MKLLGIAAATREWRWPLGSPYRLRLRIADADGAWQSFDTRDFALSIYRPEGTLRVVGVAASDGTGPYCEFYLDGAANTAIADATAPTWEIAELFADGKTPLLTGPVYVADAAPAGAAGDTPSAAYDDLSWSPERDTVIVTENGGRGTPGRDAFDYVLNFTLPTSAYLPALTAMTIDLGLAPIGSGSVDYAASSAAAPADFVPTTLPVTLEAGSWLRASSDDVVGFLAVHLRKVD
jgi:hypothetical protein